MTLRNPAQPNFPDWSSLSAHGHGVQFYSDDSSLTSLLTSYAGAALISGNAAIVLATRPHLDALTACFTARGFNPELAARQGRYIALDAEKTLAKFWVNRRVDVARFDVVIGKQIRRAQAAVGTRRSRIVAFGEMVALLSMAGERRGALALEKAWNALLKTSSFSLCCAYPMQMFDSKDPSPFLRVCAQHTHVFPAELRASRFLSSPNDRATAAAQS